jgi:hypothetical protein
LLTPLLLQEISDLTLKRIFEVKRERGIVYNTDGERAWEDKSPDLEPWVV